MKRMICLILLASLMALSVAGCGKEKDTGVLKLLEAHADVEVKSSSPTYMLNGTTQYRRRYIEIERAEEKNGRGR